MRVLIVDDHEVVRKGVRSLLVRSGYDVCGEGVDGEDAIAKAKELKPDVIVMDVSMPRLNGLETTRQVRGVLPGIQVVILSQHESPEMLRQAVSSGAHAYVTKSSIGKDLLTAIEKVGRHETFFDSAGSGVTSEASPSTRRKRSIAARLLSRRSVRTRNSIARLLSRRPWACAMSRWTGASCE
jgi:DNA-binding NarL/FixJ family response regulator